VLNYVGAEFVMRVKFPTSFSQKENLKNFIDVNLPNDFFAKNLSYSLVPRVNLLFC
jgi:hypothetical protein